MKRMPYQISVCGKHELDDFANTAVTHLLSFEDPSTPKTTPQWFHGIHLQLQFHDVESEAEAREFGAVAPTKSDVAEILQFGEECLAACRMKPVHLLVHCYVGASRSPAAGFALIASAFGAGHAKQALKIVRQLRPEAFPNGLIVRYADELLSRKGELLRALGPPRRGFNNLADEWIASVTGRKQS